MYNIIYCIKYDHIIHILYKILKIIIGNVNANGPKNKQSFISMQNQIFSF